MNQYTYIKEGTVFGINGVSYQTNASLEDESIRAIQWYGEYGEVEYLDGKINSYINDVSLFDDFIKLWNIENKKANKPNSWSVWNGTEWIEDLDLKAQQELEAKLSEAKQYLTSTDHKFFNGYKPKQDEDLVAIEAKRDEAREFIRNNKV